MSQFVCYHLGDHDESIPIATGTTRDEALRKGIVRVLSARITEGGVAVQEREDLKPEEFATLTQITDTFAKEHGLAA